MTIKSVASGVVLSMALSGTAMASDDVANEDQAATQPQPQQQQGVGSGPNPFSDCGIGAALFPRHRVPAVTSNVIWDIGTTAVTSATASPETCSGREVQAAAFILDSYDQLAEETARGAGEHITALLNLMGVAEQDRVAVIGNVRASMVQRLADRGYASAEKVQKSSAFYDSLVAAINAA